MKSLGNGMFKIQNSKVKSQKIGGFSDLDKGVGSIAKSAKEAKDAEGIADV